MLTSQQDLELKISEQYKKRYLKQIAAKPKPAWIQARRTFSTAVAILACLEDIPYETLVRSIYVYCKNNSLNWLTREYEKQIELAGANPERFVFQLHKFYNDISRKIRKQKLYTELMDFMGLYVELSYTRTPEVNPAVVNAYVNLLMQTTEYIRPSKFNFAQSIIGVTTDGQPICIAQLHPDWDLPSYEIEETMESGRISPDNAFREMIKIYAKCGYSIHTIEDIVEISEIQKVHDTTTIALMRYINEFTYDIFPQQHYDTMISPLRRMNVNVSLPNLMMSLKARKRTLPLNGTRIVFGDPSGEVIELLLKEVFKDDAVIMLYRLTTKNGDVSGYFNTRSDFLYSVNLDCTEQETYHRTKKFILYCYAVCVTNKFSAEENNVSNYGEPVAFRIYGIGGKLKAVYNAGGSNGAVHQLTTQDLESRVVAINGYIRRLPFGQSASEDAAMIARQMGYDLDSGETYVRPFCKEVFVKRKDALS